MNGAGPVPFDQVAAEIADRPNERLAAFASATNWPSKPIKLHRTTAQTTETTEKEITKKKLTSALRDLLGVFILI